ncbi:MAG: murein L,D-transpeptidase family protein [Bdellovibrionales bacterium]
MNESLLRQRVKTFILCFLAQTATALPCFASEDAKSVEVSDPTPQQPPANMYPSPLLSLQSQTGAFSQFAFLVDKSRRTLTVWQDSGDTIKLVGAWPTDIGEKKGDKLVEGDKRTPEGVYFFQTMMDGRKVDFSQYGVRIFTLDYPNYFDRLEKKTGNGIWFHAIPETKSLVRGSRGCVVVRNAVIEELAKFIELKRTPMVISDAVEYVDLETWRAHKKQYRDWIETWRSSWSSKDLDAYMNQYSEKFSGNGMNKSQWRAYKSNLNSRYEFIEIDLKDVQIFNQGPKIVFRFLQAYKSNQKEDFGSKILYALKNGDRYEIIGESWQKIGTQALGALNLKSDMQSRAN